jgi:hypothetical protein
LGVTADVTAVEYRGYDKMSYVSPINSICEDANGQIGQDIFIMTCLKNKREGSFLEIGSSHPAIINNTYFLETKYKWRGVMVEYNEDFLDMYTFYRPNSVHVIMDATKVDYRKILEENNFPFDMDFLQIDLEVFNKSTIETLEKLDREVMDTYTFATVCFEHDNYRGDTNDTRRRSRDIFDRRGYVRIFADVDDMEDWYIHPRLINDPLILGLKTDAPIEHGEAVKRLKAVQNVMIA